MALSTFYFCLYAIPYAGGIAVMPSSECACLVCGLYPADWLSMHEFLVVSLSTVGWLLISHSPAMCVSSSFWCVSSQSVCVCDDAMMFGGAFKFGWCVFCCW